MYKIDCKKIIHLGSILLVLEGMIIYKMGLKKSMIIINMIIVKILWLFLRKWEANREVVFKSNLKIKIMVFHLMIQNLKIKLRFNNMINNLKAKKKQIYWD